jgi:diacylglycerol kinase (ATP)
MAARLHFILNPAAGGGRALRAWPALAAACQQAGLPWRLHQTSASDTTALTNTLACAGAEIVVALGGDGTVSQVAAGLLALPQPVRPTLGLVALGSGDDFAHGLGLRSGDLAQAVAVLAAGHTRLLDAGCVNGQYFVCGVGTGFDAEVALAAQHAPGRLRGLPRYLWGILAVLPHLRLPALTLEADGQPFYSGPALLAAAMLMPSYGGGLRVAPAADPSDGLLDLLVGKRFSRLATLGILPRLQRGLHLGHPQIQAQRAQHLHLAWDQPVAVHADGELLPKASHYQIDVLPRALRVLAPA